MSNLGKHVFHVFALVNSKHFVTQIIATRCTTRKQIKKIFLRHINIKEEVIKVEFLRDVLDTSIGPIDVEDDDE